MKRRDFNTLVLTSLAAAGLTACGNSSSSDSKTIEMWMPPNSATDVSDKEGWDKILDAFEKEHSVTVNVTIVPWTATRRNTSPASPQARAPTSATCIWR